MRERRNIMYLILGSERANFDHYIVEAKLNVDAFEIKKEEDAVGSKNSIGTMVLPITRCYTPY